MKTEDGGYYALKGYQFQYIRALNSLLDKNNPTDYITLENIEDFETDSELIQVKYKEAKKYSKSLIKKAVTKLLEESKTTDFNLILHVYFNNYTNFEKDMGTKVINNINYEITYEYLDEILSDNSDKYTSEEKESFVERFSICFTEKYHVEVDEVIDKIKDKFKIEEVEVAFIAFNQFISHLVNIVLTHPTEDAKERICYLKELSEIHKNTNQVIVNEYLEMIVGKEKYFKIIKEKLKFRQQPMNCEKVFCLNIRSDINDYYNFISNIKRQFYKRSVFQNRANIDSPAPYIFINESEEEIVRVKDYLYENDVLFIDGYPYNGSGFKVDYISQKTEVQSNFEVKIIGNKIERQIVQNNFNKQRVYYYNFYKDQVDILDLKNDVAIVYNIKIDSIEDINNYLF